MKTTLTIALLVSAFFVTVAYAGNCQTQCYRAGNQTICNTSCY